MSCSALRSVVASLCWLLACGGAEPDGEPTFADPAGGGPNPSGSTQNGAGASSPGASAPVFGLPTDDGAAPSVSGGGCTKVDFLFVVDNSLSMLEEQTALINSFPGFMRVVEEALGASDFHVMVVDTDAGDVRDLIAALLGQGLDPCGPTLGAGRRESQAGQDCGLTQQRRYLDASQPDLAGTFSCVAQVGTLGNPREAPVEAMLAAIAPALNAPGACNAGFLRDDAILVVTLIGDEDDAVSSGDPATWRNALVNAKGGDADSIVFLGLIGGDANTAATASCAEQDAAQPAPRLRNLAESFPHGSVGDICSPDYAPFFSETVSVIDTACDAFQPVIR